LLDGNNRWFIANDALILDVDQCVGGSKIDRKIVGKHPEQGIEHRHSLFRREKRRLKQRKNSRFVTTKQENEIFQQGRNW
jgi:hypothetical protein